MLLAQFLEGFFDGPNTSGFEILVSAPNTFYRFLKVLGLPFGGDRDHFHGSRVGTS